MFLGLSCPSLGGFSVLCYRTRGAAISPFVPTVEIPSTASLETCHYLAQTHTLLVMKFGFTDCQCDTHKHMHTHTQRQTPSLDDLEFVSFHNMFLPQDTLDAAQNDMQQQAIQG